METDKRIAWRSIDTDDANVKTSGQVTFNELPNNQTEVTVTMHYVPPAGIVGEVAAELFANPEKRLAHDFWRTSSALSKGTMRKAVTHTEASKMGNVSIAYRNAAGGLSRAHRYRPVAGGHNGIRAGQVSCQERSHQRSL